MWWVMLYFSHIVRKIDIWRVIDVSFIKEKKALKKMHYIIEVLIHFKHCSDTNGLPYKSALDVRLFDKSVLRHFFGIYISATHDCIAFHGHWAQIWCRILIFFKFKMAASSHFAIFRYKGLAAFFCLIAETRFNCSKMLPV